MAKLPRVTQVIFAGSEPASAGGIGIFGSAAAAAPAFSLNTSTIMTSAPWLLGWNNATLGASKFPAIEDMNAVDYVHSSQIAYILQQGIAEYDAGTTYYLFSRCTDPNTGITYISQANANINNPLTDAAHWLPADRTRLTANTTFNVSTTGNDSTGNGTAGAPWLTIQHAINYIANNIDCAGFSATISLANGTYTAGGSLSAPVLGSNILNIIGGAAVIISTTSSNCFSATTNGSLHIDGGMKLQTTTNGNCIDANSEGIITVGNVNFGACAGAHVSSFNNSQVTIGSNYSITGGALQHWICHDVSSLIINAVTITLTGMPAFTDFCDCGAISFVGAIGITFTGAATGQKYISSANSLIQTGGASINYFPGNAAGTTNNNGLYI